jgi:hypothetical protein
MPNNLHISYDLKNPGRDYEAVIGVIKGLGSWAKIHYSFWYVDSRFTTSQARDAILRVLDSNDTVYVVDASNNDAAWHNLSSQVAEHIGQRWRAKAA